MLASRIRPNKLGLDIGGTLVKVAALKGHTQLWRNLLLEHTDVIKIGKHEEVKVGYTKSVTDVLEALSRVDVGSKVHVTGGGAYKYDKEIRNSLDFGNKDTEVVKVCELGSIAEGTLALIEHTDLDLYTYRTKEGAIMAGEKTRSEFPKLIVNVGSGASYILCKSGYPSPNYTRVTGTMVSGGTLLGLSNLIYNKHMDYSTMLQKADKGDLKNVDILVKDIYGSDSGFQIDGDIVAGTLCKIPDLAKEENGIENIRKEDVLHSIGFMVSANISHIAVLSAQLHKSKQIIFTGNFGAGNDHLMDSLTFGVDFHSQGYKVPGSEKGGIPCYFLDKAGYSGAISCLLKE
ncbi:unnamed protein product [Moneuplotes crassus]|uniref:Pantothenate kinase n=1 Tax=Euplotes crassus TaxID=5936 RepID=A0AAD1XK67_EUPCR|nr:unnamed protein product [Moneuplotes crassus]